MADVPKTNAERSLAICSLFESELLVWLLLRNWRHPLADDSDFRDQLLESATGVLQAAASGPRENVFIEGVPASDMNLVAAVWYAESQSLDDWGDEIDPQREARLRWLAEVQRAVPSCFCAQDRLL